jgi:NSS family neurotransmitter:Na+ symporter
MKRELWKSHIGFMWAAIGSAVGLGSIWRFPYIVGQNGGAAFVLLFAFFLVFVSLPVLIAEIVIGRKTHLNPSGAYRQLGKTKRWGRLGLLSIATGFIVSSFYSVICGWTLGYLIDAVTSQLTNLHSIAESQNYFNLHVSSPFWAIATHFSFMFLATLILFVGVQKGIEASNKVFMPMLFILLFLLAIKGLTMSHAKAALSFLFSPDWKSLTPAAIIMALGQALFGLSIGQGTMVTYGSYLSKNENIPKTAFPIAISVIIVSLLAGIAIFTVVFSAGAVPTGGTNLMFQTLPLIFSQMTGGFFLAILFFLLIFIAGLTSQISAMEPVISYFMDEKEWSRHKATFWAGFGAFLLGIPSALSFGLWKGYTFFGMNFFDAISFVSINILIPLGGLFAVVLVGWKWGIKEAFLHLKEGTGKFYAKHPSIDKYLRFNIKYISPVIIIIILLNLLGII